MKRLGFTLIELLIYMAVIPFVLAVFTQVFHSILDVQLESESVSSVETDGSYLLARFQYDLHHASSVTQPVSPGDSGSTLGFVVSGDPYTYSVTDGALSLTTPLGTDRLNTQGTRVSDFNVTRIGNSLGRPTIRIGFNLTSNTLSLSGKTQTRSYLTTVSLR
jgi:hypothetical protein